METTLKNNGYAVESKKEDGIIATKDKNRFFIRRFQISTNRELVSQMEILKETSHCHIVNTQNSFTDQDMYYVVMEDCQGETLAEKIRGMSEPLQESEALSLIVELCLALKTIQDKGLLHKHLTPQTILLTESGTLRLGGFGKIQASVIWSLGGILYELCTKQVFSAVLTSGPNPVPQGQFSSEFLELLSDMLSKNPDLRPTVHEILDRPIVLRCLLAKCKTTTDHLQDQLDKLKGMADDLERFHWNTTMGSLTGGAIGVMGGITSIVGIALAPATLGASLAVAGVGAGVGLAGGLTAGALNITKATKESSDRKAFIRIIKEFEEKMNALTVWLQEIDNNLQTICKSGSADNDSPEQCDLMFLTSTGRSAREVYPLAQVARSDATMTQISRVAQIAGAASAASATRIAQVARSGTTMTQISRAAREAGTASVHFAGGAGHMTGSVKNVLQLYRSVQIPRAARFASATRSGTTVAQMSRVAQIARTASAVFSGFVVAVDLFFIVKDAQELHNIMEFLKSIRKAAVELQQVLDEFKNIMAGIDTLYRTAMAIWGVNVNEG